MIKSLKILVWWSLPDEDNDEDDSYDFPDGDDSLAAATVASVQLSPFFGEDISSKLLAWNFFRRFFMSCSVAHDGKRLVGSLVCLIGGGRHDSSLGGGRLAYKFSLLLSSTFLFVGVLG